MLMIEQVLAQLVAWRTVGLTLGVSVNVSVRDLHGREFVDWLGERLRVHGVDPSCLQLELTESALMTQTEAVVDSLKAVRQLGVGASLDDFGTGFSSLQHIRRLPLTEIKIDRSFVQAMMKHGQEESIVRSVIELGKSLGLRVVAEGVEDDETRLWLLDSGVPCCTGLVLRKTNACRRLCPVDVEPRPLTPYIAGDSFRPLGCCGVRAWFRRVPGLRRGRRRRRLRRVRPSRC
jgi:EAL domain-containing protein (putative c-di-GMP-specific phosphodiesterase class I)